MYKFKSLLSVVLWISVLIAGKICPGQPSDPCTFVFVQGGTFTMGNNGTEGNDDEQPRHKVKIADFYIGETEITQAQWVSVMGKNPSLFSGCDSCPVENVSWSDVQRFLKKINKGTKGVVYRLPSEAEWEYAAMGGQKSNHYRFAGSNNLDALGWYKNNADAKTHAVKTKLPNELGLYDMNGNVGEWCIDWVSPYKDYEQNNPTGKMSGLYKIYRGGSWDQSAVDCRNKSRHNLKPDDKGEGKIGFRLVKIVRKK